MQTEDGLAIDSVPEMIRCVLDCVRGEVELGSHQQRSHERYPLHMPVEIGRCAIGNDCKPCGFERYCLAWMVDISMTGIGILVTEPWVVDDLGLLWVNVQAMVPQVECSCGGVLPIKPRYCVKMLEHTYRVGCEFEINWKREISRMGGC